VASAERPQPSFKDALGSFVDQSKQVAKLQRQIAAMRKAEAALSNLRAQCDKLVETWRAMEEYYDKDADVDVHVTYRVVANELERVLEVNRDIDRETSSEG